MEIISTAGEYSAAEKTVMNPLLQRFRPIAPKPISAGGSGSGGSQCLVHSKPRTKRKYVRVCKNSRRRKRRISSPSSEEEKNSGVTLQLLPENTELNPREINLNIDPVRPSTISELEENTSDYYHQNRCGYQGLDLTVMGKREVVESWVTVVCLTDNTCMEMGALGRISTDVERVKYFLEEDTCPGLITDGCFRVQWVNTAYKMMVTPGGGNGGEISPEIRAWLLVKEDLAFPGLNAAFSCRVKVQYAWRKEKWSKTVPCDVRRVDGGAFAWRLDVEAALSLGR